MKEIPISLPARAQGNSKMTIRDAHFQSFRLLAPTPPKTHRRTENTALSGVPAGHSSRGEFVSTDRRNILLCAALYVIAVALANPVLEMGTIDDWSYTHIAREFADTGRIGYNGWVSAILIPQIVWSAAFIKLLGFSFLAGRLPDPGTWRVPDSGAVSSSAGKAMPRSSVGVVRNIAVHTFAAVPLPIAASFMCLMCLPSFSSRCLFMPASGAGTPPPQKPAPCGRCCWH